MGSNETATATTGGPRVIDVFTGNEAPTGPNYTLFSGADRLLEASRGRSGSGYAPVPHTPSMRQSSAPREPWKQTMAYYCYLPNDLRNRRNLARGGYSSSPVPDLQGQARLRHSFREFLHRGWRRARTTGGERQGRGSRLGPVVLDSTS